MSGHEVRILTDATELACEAAELFAGFARQAGDASGRFSVALSGGSTPKALYSQLTTREAGGRIDWSRVDFFFGDERCVPPDHQESNYRLAHEALFLPLGVKDSQVFRMHGEASPPESASTEYEQVIRRQMKTPAPSWPRFDLILLGLGDDGHTASLFPGTAAVDERVRLVVPSTAPKGISERITMTIPLLNQADAVMFLVTGSSKAPRVREILEPRRGQECRLPAALIDPSHGRLLWLLDRAAAAELTVSKQQVVTHEE